MASATATLTAAKNHRRQRRLRQRCRRRPSRGLPPHRRSRTSLVDARSTMLLARPGDHARGERRPDARRQQPLPRAAEQRHAARPGSRDERHDRRGRARSVLLPSRRSSARTRRRFRPARSAATAFASPASRAIPARGPTAPAAAATACAWSARRPRPRRRPRGRRPARPPRRHGRSRQRATADADADGDADAAGLPPIAPRAVLGCERALAKGSSRLVTTELAFLETCTLDALSCLAAATATGVAVPHPRRSALPEPLRQADARPRRHSTQPSPRACAGDPPTLPFALMRATEVLALRDPRRRPAPQTSGSPSPRRARCARASSTRTCAGERALAVAMPHLLGPPAAGLRRQRRRTLSHPPSSDGRPRSSPRPRAPPCAASAPIVDASRKLSSKQLAVAQRCVDSLLACRLAGGTPRVCARRRALRPEARGARWNDRRARGPASRRASSARCSPHALRCARPADRSRVRGRRGGLSRARRAGADERRHPRALPRRRLRVCAAGPHPPRAAPGRRRARARRASHSATPSRVRSCRPRRRRPRQPGRRRPRHPR